VSFEETLGHVRALCGCSVTATLYDAAGKAVGRWEGEQAVQLVPESADS
jgi:hypothetical protein